MSMTDSTQKLLGSVSATVREFEARYQETGETYNIFKAKGIEEKETILCSVIANLLNPNGTHGRGSLYLKHFMKAINPLIGQADTLNLARTRVTTEYSIDVNDKRRRIDIAIDDARVFIPIEVKIKHREGEGQLADYAAFSRKMNAGSGFGRVLFLTPDGRESKETP